MSRERIAFADELRGVAALAVAVSHLVGVFWLMRDVVSAVTFTPAQPGPPHPWAIDIAFPWFSLGPFGVALFFLISGLVIPFSLANHTAGGFLLARLLRIYPTYIIALLLQLALLRANAAYWGLPFALDPAAALSNLLLVHDLAGKPSLDLVNWSLCIELRFYLVVALCAPLIRRGSLGALLAIALLAYGANRLAAAGLFGPPVPDPVLPVYTVSTETLFISFMLVGVLFNFHLRRLLSTPMLLLAVPVLAGLFLLTWRSSVLAGQWPGVPANYVLALGLFAALYAARGIVPSVPGLPPLAAVSYPLYLVHGLVGYSVLRLLILRFGMPYPWALAAAAAAALLLAAVLHVTVERATIRWGQRLRRPLPAPVLAGAAAE